MPFRVTDFIWDLLRVPSSNRLDPTALRSTVVLATLAVVDGNDRTRLDPPDPSRATRRLGPTDEGLLF